MTVTPPWRIFFTFMKMLPNVTFICMVIKKVFLSLSIATISTFLQKCTLWRHNFETSQPKIGQCDMAVEAGLEPKMILWLLYTLECQIDVGLRVATVYHFQSIFHDYNLTWDYRLLIKKVSTFINFGEKNPMATSIWHPMSIYHTRVMRECGKHCRIYIAWFTKYAAILALCLINKVCNKSVFVHQLLSFKHCCRLLANYWSSIQIEITGNSLVIVIVLHCKFFPLKKCGGSPCHKTYPVKCM